VSQGFSAQGIRQAFDDARNMDGSMDERLAAFASAARLQNPAAAAVVDRLVERLKTSGAGDAAPQPGDVMPLFALPDEAGRVFSLRDLLRSGPAVVTFHRGHWCPYCRISMNTLAKAYGEIVRHGAQMVAIVPDRQPFAAEMKADSNVRFPVLTDMDNGYAMSLNLAIWVGTEMEQFMKSIGRELPKYQGNESWTLPIPATFVVGRDGRVKARFVDPDYRHRMAIDDLLAALD
jgi:peroxiredoxin